MLGRTFACGAAAALAALLAPGAWAVDDASHLVQSAALSVKPKLRPEEQKVVDVVFDPATLLVVEGGDSLPEMPVRPNHTLSLWSQSNSSKEEELLSSGFKIYIGSTDNRKGHKRTKRLTRLCSEQGLLCVRLVPVMAGGKLYGLARTVAMGMKLFLDSGSQLGLYVEDDAVFMPNFKAELAMTMRELPRNWTVFHLCPGFLHNRTDETKRWDLNPENSIEGTPRTSASGRAFLDWPRGKGCCTNDQGVLAGGPVAMLMTPPGALDLSRKLDAITAAGADALEPPTPTDVAFRDLGCKELAAAHTHFVARSPQFCKEVHVEN